MGVNTCEVRVGRLMEIRIDHGYNSLDDVEDMRAKINRGFQQVGPEQQVVVVADWRHTRLMAAEASDSAGKMIGSFNDRIERSGVVAAGDSPLAVLQFLRVIRESKHPRRKLCNDVQELKQWLGELLTPGEAQRLDEFIARADL